MFRYPHCARHWRRFGFVAAFSFALAGVGSAARADNPYSPILLGDVADSDDSYAFSVSADGQLQGGYSVGNSSQGRLWQSSPLGYRDLTDTQRYRFTLARGMTPDGGFAIGSGSPKPDLPYHAALWKTSDPTLDNSLIDLNPAGYVYSFGYGISADGKRQVGEGNRFPLSSPHFALLWQGSAQSVINLQPSAYSNSVAYGISGDGVTQVGEALGADWRAVLWRGSAQSVVDLQPTGWRASEAHAASFNGALQIGYAYDNQSDSMATHDAILWNGSPSSFVNLTPTGFIGSLGLGISPNGKFQVGIARRNTTGPTHALLWRGAANDYLDLNAFLPAGFDFAVANSVNDNGDVVGQARVVATGAYQAMLWRRVAAAAPEPASLALFPLGLLALGVALRRREHNPGGSVER